MMPYPVPGAPWRIVNLELLQLLQSQNGSCYLRACVDPFDSALAPLIGKTAARLAHALVTHVMCPPSSTHIILSDNGTTFEYAVLNDLYTQFLMKHSFITAYHPVANGLAEGANRIFLLVLIPIVFALLDTWEDWLPQIDASIDTSVNDSPDNLPTTPYMG